MKHLIHLLTIATLLTAWSGTSAAQTRGAATECEVCLREVDFEQCENEALEHDKTRDRLRECQRDLDAKVGEGNGASRALQRELTRERVEHANTRLQLIRVEEELKRRPRWRRVVIAVGVAILSGYAAGRAHQWGRERN